MTQPAARAEPVSRERVIETALRLVEDENTAALTMRRLAAELGTAVTSIYWHVGNRDTLLDLLVERLVADMRQVRVSGRSPRARITSLCRQWRRRLWEQPHLIAIAHERGRTAAMFQPVQAAMARELAAVGVRGEAAAVAVRTLQVHVVSSIVLQRTAGRSRHDEVTEPTAWPAWTDDPELVTALARPMDYEAVFDVGLDALLDRLLPA